jgi:hypothetical protein
MTQNDFEPSDPYVIQQQLIQAWINLPDSEVVSVELTKTDWDRLYFAFTQCVRAQSVFQNAVAALSNGKTDEASLLSQDAFRTLTWSETNFRKFFASVMLSATRRGN